MILLIDNYDSFSYNLYQLVGAIKPDIKVIRNDALTVEEIKNLRPTHIIISPGPGRPERAGVCVELIRNMDENVPLLGVCLGHQAICYAFGATIGYAQNLMHGKASLTEFDTASPLFMGLPTSSKVARYHSLAAVAATLPPCLKITARAADGEIMAVEHRERPIYGVQFHPESILTPEGEMILENFLSL
ncbi:MAG: aminodeoxychorismate/anthranilate synthase component II [Selenomonadaceae bacterium]|nr:aminodeoxychorismate/anthranilate synthase component II [Selenomonadaceae bacterium]